MLAKVGDILSDGWVILAKVGEVYPSSNKLVISVSYGPSAARGESIGSSNNG